MIERILDLHDQARAAEPERAAAGEHVDAAVGAGWRFRCEESLGLENLGHEAAQLMAGELLGDEGLDLVHAEPLQIEARLGRVRRVLVVVDRVVGDVRCMYGTASGFTGWSDPSTGIAARQKELLQAPCSVVALYGTDSPCRSK